MRPEPADLELDTQIALLESPLGGEPHVREREGAAAWLLARPDRSYPALLARASEGIAGPATVELLGEFGRADSVPVLAALLDREEPMGSVAAGALAGQPDPAALDALREGLRRGGERAVRCADALGARGDPAACPDLHAAAEGSDARLRYHAIQAAAAPELDCLSPARLLEIEASDPDADVRALARSLYEGQTSR
jgi:HEAT repeat protein